MSHAKPEWMIRAGALCALAIALAALAGCFVFRCPESPPTDFLPTVLDPDMVDRSLITGEPCAPPCWQGLVPGESTAEEAMAVLQSAPFVDSSSVEHTSSEVREAIEWESSVSEQPSWSPPIGSIELSEGRISSIPLNLEYELRLQDLVEVMGEPAGYFVAELPSQGGPMCFDYSVQFIWPEEGLAAMVRFVTPFDISQHEQLLPAEMLVITRVVYSSPAASAWELLAARGASERTAQDYYECCFEEWRGFNSVTMP